MRRVKEVRPMAFVFDYELLKESYEINLETQECNENDASEDDVEPEETDSQLPPEEPELPF